jgi:8-amino-7-oxononanoate synthase
MKLIHIFRTNINLPSNMKLFSNFLVFLSGNNNAVKLSRVLQKAGYNVKPIRSPTVPAGKERVRICIHANNTEKQIYGLINAIENYFEKQNISKEISIKCQIVPSKL